MLNIKRCPKCANDKDVALFGKCTSNKDGLQVYCKQCRREQASLSKEKLAEYRRKYYADNKEEIKNSNKKYYEQNREKILEYQKQYAANNEEKLTRYMREYYEKNKEQVASQQHQYYLSNKDSIRKRMRTYQQENNEAILARSAERRANKLQATPSWADKQSILGMYVLADLFSKTGVKMHVDHIIPLKSDKVCGLHCEDNLQLLPASDNIAKGNRHWPDMWA